MRKVITDDLDALLGIFPSHIQQPLREKENISELLEVILDLGRPPEARFPNSEIVLSPTDISEQDIEYTVSRIGKFGDDNRAGIPRTLHRISAIRNRQGHIVGLTCRVGRAVYGTIRVIEDLIKTGKSVLLLGRPGVGKTTMLREVARVLADDFKKRVIIVDTSNEIAGDGDIPHPAIGHARRMQVTTPEKQHAVMIEAVENHMPEVIVIDEIGTELEAMAARTIAERGVQLIGTAHGNTLENLILNPTLSDLIGGIQSVTLSDEVARQRGTQKTILERASPPTFSIVVEIQDRDRVAVHPDVAEAVDSILRGREAPVEVRRLNEETGEVQIERPQPQPASGRRTSRTKTTPQEAPRQRLFLFGVNRGRFEQVASEIPHDGIEVVDKLGNANIFVTSKAHYRRRPQKVKEAEAANLPIYVLRSNTPSQIKQFLNAISRGVRPSGMENMTGDQGYMSEHPRRTDTTDAALDEAQQAIELVKQGQPEVELSPQSSYIRRLQHIVAERNELSSTSVGKEPLRRVKIFR